MKNNEEIEKIHIENKMAIPHDMGEIKKKLLSNELEDVEVVNVGINRNQFFVRLPTRITKRLNLSKKDKLKIIATSSGENVFVEMKILTAKDTDSKQLSNILEKFHFFDTEILRFLAKHNGWVTSNYLADRLKLAWITADKHLKELHKTGYIEKGKSEKGRLYWRINQ